ncbi:MAG: YppF family protein [Bacillota bacterium]|nr:YppF family protein [Bacillota bacterium]
MNISELKNRFIQSKDFSTDNVNQLLDFAKKAYIHNEINIKEYSLLIRDLEAKGAMVPDSDNDNSLISHTN